MGLHSFKSEPDHCNVYRAHVGPHVPNLYGYEENWNMPVVRHRRALGAGMDFRGVDHYVLTYHVGGSSARRRDRSDSGNALSGAISLQRPQSAGRFSSRGVVEYAHFYFSQSLVDEVADEMQQGAQSFEDFFAVQDSVWSRDAEAYLFRANNCDDPPTSIEMDGRAYLIVAGLQRVALKLNSAPEQLPAVGRADLRKALDAIEGRLDEQLRLSELSQIVGMSPFHFARVFKEEVGEPPAQFIMRRRAERAVELIRTTSLPLSEISFRMGFSSQSHMSRHVKSLTGQTPGQLRD